MAKRIDGFLKQCCEREEGKLEYHWNGEI